MQPLKGTIFYASAKAMRERLYKEGQHVTITSYRNYRHYSDNFVEVNLTSDPTCYVHLTLDEAQENYAMNLTKKQVKAFLEVLSSDDARPVLTQASIELYNDVSHLVATDGYTLAAIPVNGVSDMIGRRIEREDLVKWYKLASNKDIFTDENVRELAKEVYTDFGEKDTEGKLYGKYPEWQKLVPTGEHGSFSTVSLNAKYLLTMQTLVGQDEGIEMQFYGDKFSPVVIKHDGILCLVMPLKR